MTHSLQRTPSHCCFILVLLGSFVCGHVAASIQTDAVSSNSRISSSTAVDADEEVGNPVRILRSDIFDGPIIEENNLSIENKEDVHLNGQRQRQLASADEENEAPGADDSAATARETQGKNSNTPSNYRAAWVAHGTIAAIAWGLFVPFAIGSAWFRDLIPTYWIYIHVFVNVSTFALTFFAVGIAFATMKSMGEAGEGHMKERHHIVGLLLLLLVSFQTANGFLRPPREYVSDDDSVSHVNENGNGRKSMTARTLWILVHSANGLFLFALGTWQVHSGLNMFSTRFGTANWGAVYLGYIFWLAIVFGGLKFWMKWKDRQVKLQAWRHGDVHDPESDLTPVQYE